jgi:hypothetical protein
MFIILALLLSASSARAGHSASVGIAIDPIIPQYTGTSNPGGAFQINLSGGLPGYLNGIGGGENGGSEGCIIIQRIPQSTFLVGIAITLADQAGPSHSISTLNDPALGDIVADLNVGSGGSFAITAYPYDAAPSQYSGAQATLSASESAKGGQPFGILLVGVDTFPLGRNEFVWNFAFSNEIGNLDGITSLAVTDVGALPEPSACIIVFGCAPFLIRHRAREVVIAT